MALKEKPPVIPGLNQLQSMLDATEKQQLNFIREHFALKMFVGRLVTNWCQSCGRWRINYVSAEKAKTVSPADTFPCTMCGRALQLLVDEQHTLMKNA